MVSKSISMKKSGARDGLQDNLNFSGLLINIIPSANYYNTYGIVMGQISYPLKSAQTNAVFPAVCYVLRSSPEAV